MATYFKRKTPAVEIKGGREICTDTAAGRREYRRRTEEMAVRQNMICHRCKDPNNLMSLAKGFPFSATFDHLGKDGKGGGRGLGGSRRDDRITDDNGIWMNAAAHWICNGIAGCSRG